MRKNSAGLERVSAGSAEKEHFWKRPAIPLILAMIWGIFWGKFRPLPFWLVCGLSGVSLVLLLFSLRKRFFLSASLLPLVAFGFLGHMIGLSVHSPEREALRLHEFCKNEKLFVTGIVHGIPSSRANRTRMILSEVKVERVSGEFFAADGFLFFTLYDPETVFVPGNLVRIHGKVKALYNFENPGGFDYRSFQFGKNIIGRISSKRKDVELLESDQGGFSSKVDRFRLALSDHIRKVVSDVDSAAVLATMLVGDQRFLSGETRNTYTRTGISHILSISGLHVSLLAGGLFFLLERFLRSFPFLILRGWTWRIAVPPAILFTISYALASGGAPSALRAVAMAVCLFVLLSMRRATDSWSLLLLAAGFLLAMKPEWSTSIGFLLSFSSVCGLILGFSKYPVKKRGKGFRARFYGFFEGLVKTSLFAFLFTFPICLFIFRQIPMISIAANLVMVPIMAMVVLPLAMAGIFIGIFSENFGNFLLFVSGRTAELGNELAFRMSEIPFACLEHLTLTLVECLLLYGLFFLWFGWKRVFVGLRIRLILVCVFTVCSGANIFHWVESRNGPDHPLVLQFDVGQGSGAVIRLPGGSVFLVDGGGFPWEDAMDTGERIFSPWLDMQRIRTIDAMVLTHPHSDHGRGFLYLAENYTVKELWIARQALEEPMGKELIGILRDRGTRIRHPASEDSPVEAGGVRFRFLGPGEKNFRNTNDRSLVFRMETDVGDMLFTGDIEEEAEAYYLGREKAFLGADVLQVPHHGSRISSSEDFLQAVSPSLALISCGQDNIYRYPAAEVLRRLEENRVRVFRTDQGGAVAVSFEEEGPEAAYRPIGLWDRLW